MFAYLQGKLSYLSPALVHLDVQGVGYELHISLNTYEAIQNKAESRLFVHLQVKEDAHTLFGFADKAEKDLFLLLISVSGVGAATARMMLSSLKPTEITAAIFENNIRLLESVKGIGRKTAERIVLELREKIGKLPTSNHITTGAGNSLQQDALTALSALGISRAQAEAAIQKTMKADPGISLLEELIKKALKAI